MLCFRQCFYSHPCACTISILILLVFLIDTYEKAQGSLLGDETPLDESDYAEVSSAQALSTSSKNQRIKVCQGCYLMWSKDTPLHKAGLILKERENPHSEQAIGCLWCQETPGLTAPTRKFPTLSRWR